MFNKLFRCGWDKDMKKEIVDKWILATDEANKNILTIIL